MFFVWYVVLGKVELEGHIDLATLYLKEVMGRETLQIPDIDINIYIMRNY